MDLKTIYKITAFILMVIILSTSPVSIMAAANTESSYKTESSTQVENSLINKLEGYMDQCKDGTASVSFAVFDSESIIYKTYYGFADIENNIAADSNTVYEWGPVTKMLVWVSVMQLYEQDKIDLNEDIKAYLPEGFMTKLKYDEPITMLHLMNHTAGFAETVYNDGVETDDMSMYSGLKEALLKSQPSQIYKPGEVCSYSNWSAALAGYIVEHVSGQPFNEYVKEHIFSVLGMEHTSILPDFSDNSWVQAQRNNLSCYSIF